MNQDRIHYLDWLKVLIVYGILVFHASLVFSIGGAWLIENHDRDLILSAFAGFCFLWGIPAMFLISGADAWFGLRSHSAAQFLRGRVQRLLVPFVAAFVVLSPLQRYLVNHNPPPPIQELPGFYQDFFHGLVTNFSPPWVASYWMHLWFLAYLFAISIFCLPVLEWLRRPSGRHFTARLVKMTGHRGGLLLLGAPLVISQVALRPVFPSYQGWADVATYTVIFAAGAVLFSDRGFERAIRNSVRLFLITGTIAIAVVGLILLFSPNRTPTAAWSIPFGFFWGLDIWSWLMALLYLGVRWLDRPSRVLAYTRETVLPFYVIHHPVVLLIASFVVATGLGVWPKFAIIVGGGLALTLGIYEFGVRRWDPVRLAFGLKVKPRTADSRSAKARITSAVNS